MTRAARSGLVAALLVTALPAFAAAEGNVLALDCQMLAPADEAAAETTAPATDRHGFTIAPVKTARDGSGTIEAAGSDGGGRPGVTGSHSGPFAWTAGTVLNTPTVEESTADGRTLVLWHRLDQAQAAVPPVGQLTKLTCELS